MNPFKIIFYGFVGSLILDALSYCVFGSSSGLAEWVVTQTTGV